MRCIFCKAISDKSKSREHIIPESLGNVEHVLERGVVCDSCNQYFAIKLEKILLDYPYFKHVRHYAGILSKKGRVPLIQGIMGGIVDIGRDKSGTTFISVDNSIIMNKITSGQIKHLIVPIINEPEKNDKIVSRFIGKVAIESLAYIFYPTKGWNEEIVDKPELDSLRQYVRFGNKITLWEYNLRKIYDESDIFINPKISNEHYEILHEFKFQYSAENELFFVIAIMGFEYVISLGNPKIDGYRNWLIDNGHRSPLEDRNEIKYDAKQ